MFSSSDQWQTFNDNIKWNGDGMAWTEVGNGKQRPQKAFRTVKTLLALLFNRQTLYQHRCPNHAERSVEGKGDHLVRRMRHSPAFT